VGDTVCDFWGNVYVVINGFLATNQSIDQWDDNWSKVYKGLSSSWFKCNIVDAPLNPTENSITAKSFKDLVTFDLTLGSYKSIDAGTPCYE
jgi:hypothetical protein